MLSKSISAKLDKSHCCDLSYASEQTNIERQNNYGSNDMHIGALLCLDIWGPKCSLVQSTLLDIDSDIK